MNRSIIKSLIARHKTLWRDKSCSRSAKIGILFFIGSLFVNYGAIKYAFLEAGNSTTDILLGNLPVINTDIIFSEGMLLSVIFVTFLLILKPNTIFFITYGIYRIARKAFPKDYEIFSRA